MPEPAFGAISVTVAVEHVGTFAIYCYAVILPVATIGYEDFIKGELITYRKGPVILADISAPSTGAENTEKTSCESTVNGCSVDRLVVATCRGIYLE